MWNLQCGGLSCIILLTNVQNLLGSRWFSHWCSRSLGCIFSLGIAFALPERQTRANAWPLWSFKSLVALPTFGRALKGHLSSGVPTRKDRRSVAPTLTFSLFFPHSCFLHFIADVSPESPSQWIFCMWISSQSLCPGNLTWYCWYCEWS